MKNLNIAILDGFTTVRTDLNWNNLDKFGKVTAYERTDVSQIIERAECADIVLSNKVPLFKEQLDALPNLKYIGILATGYNNVDLDYAAKKNIPVSNIPAYGTDSVAQAIFAHILNIANKVQAHSDAVNAGEWSRSADICFCLSPLTEVASKTLGIIGYGAIGRKTAQIAKAFGMRPIAFSPSRAIGSKDEFCEFVGVDEVFKRADIIALCCVLNEATKNIVCAQNLAKAKDGVWIINTGRGGLVEENDLAQALRSGKVGAAGLDVLSCEPPRGGNVLIGAPNCFITPHNAWTTREARSRLISIVAANIESWIAGSPQNILNI